MTSKEEGSFAGEHDDLEPRRLEHPRLEQDDLDQDALRVISRLTRNGYEAYLVGGCVRDLLLGRKPKDFDVATAAHPRQVKRLFANGRIIGRRFRLVHVAYGSHIIETATFRRAPIAREADEDLLIVEDNEYGTAREDAQRRDFTINALFYDALNHRVIDYVGGLDDLEAAVLRTIGDPRVRMAEDPVRILRAVKFATRLGFRIDDQTWSAMCELSPDLARSAKPRVLEEILRLLRSGTSLGAFRMLRACGALRVILPQIDEYLGARNEPDPAAHDRADSFWRLLEALDSEVHAGHAPTPAVSIAVLCLRLIERDSAAKGREAGDLGESAADLLEPFALTMRLSRRDGGRAQRIIVQQRRFSQVASKRFSPLLFIRAEEFPEALHLFKLRSMAWGQGWDVYDAWVSRVEKAHQASPEELDAARRTTKKRRRRRRGGSTADRPEPVDASDGGPE
ncbi:MAG: polynucleotide adenylyltransferase PcnB [Planctomycetes bacterium]|nr:polynucleotide adenylyltransferase PcnB [Planctomycetota bacterium]